MTIEKATVTELQFVNRLPDETERVDQQRIEFILNGDKTVGASYSEGSDGPLNRPSVQIQENVVTIHDNVKIINAVLDETVDAVNLLTGGGSADYGTRITNNETAIASLQSISTANTVKIGNDGSIEGVPKSGLYLLTDTNAIAIGTRNAADVVNINLTESTLWNEVWFIKNSIIGNIAGFDPNGNANASYTINSGLYASIGNNTTAITSLQADTDVSGLINVADTSSIKNAVQELATRLTTTESNTQTLQSDIDTTSLTGLTDNTTLLAVLQELTNRIIALESV